MWYQLVGLAWDSVKKQAVTGSPMPAMLGVSLSKNPAGGSSEMGAVPVRSLSRSGLAFLIVAIKLFKKGNY